MDVKQAIAKARTYLTTVFASENISEVRLEEVEYDRHADAWSITFGLMRPSATTRTGQIAAIMGDGPMKRTYKVVRVPSDERELPSIRIREFHEE